MKIGHPGTKGLDVKYKIYIDKGYRIIFFNSKDEFYDTELIFQSWFQVENFAKRLMELVKDFKRGNLEKYELKK